MLPQIRRPLKHFGLYCYLDLRVAIAELGLRVTYSKTAQVVLVENHVPPQALCLTRRSPSDLGSYCLPRQEDLIKPRGRDADQVPLKEVGKIFKASPLLRPRPTSGLATSSLAPIAEVEQPIVIEDNDDAQMTGGASQETSGAEGSTVNATKGSPQECATSSTKGTTFCGTVCGPT